MRFPRLFSKSMQSLRQRAKRRAPRRRLRIEALESRRVLALVISEVHISPLFGSSDKDQYVELRGAPNQTIGSGTYFITLEGWGAVPGGQGYIHSVIDVSNVTLGSNGFLTITQAGNLYSIDPQSARLTGTQAGFAGLPDNRWSDATTLSDRLAFIAGANTFLLVKSPTKPVPTSDADANDDGTFDGDAANWTVLDSVGLLNSTAGPSRSYGRITFSESVDNLYPAGTTFVFTDGGGYVGRIGASSGWNASDWVSGTTIADDVNPNSLYRFTYGTFGDPRPLVYSGRSINTLGTYNFNGGFQGFTGLDSNNDGSITPDETPVPGVTVFADRNGNGLRDSFQVEVIAAKQPLGNELANNFPNATLTVADRYNENIGFAVRTRSTFDNDFNTITVLSSEGIPWFDSGSRLKVMFYREADSVSIEAIAAETLKASYGRLEVYDRNNNLITVAQTGPLQGTARQTIGITRPQADIKYAIIYTNDNVQNSSPFGPFDKLQYSYPEFQAISDSNGQFAIEELPVGPYQLTLGSFPGDKIPLDSNTGVSLFVQRTEHRFDGAFGFRQNALPVIQTSQLLISENPIPNSIVGKVIASDDDPGQSLTYRFLGPAGPFSLNAITGDVKYNNSSPWDFETNIPIVVDVEVSDSLSIPGKAVKSLTITPVDVNEPPVIQAATFTLPENSPASTPVGTVFASDPDAGLAGQFTFSLGITNPIGAFSINANTGAITVLSSAGLDYETKSTILVPVIATDKGNPPQSSTRTIAVNLTDINEPPSNILFANVVSVPENASTFNPIIVAAIVVVDDALGTNSLALSGPDASAFSIANGVLRLNSGTTLDFETKPKFIVVVSADDPSVGSTPDVSATFTLQITDINDPPRGVQFSNLFNPVPENTNVSTAIRVADLSALDDTSGTNNFFVASGLDSANFQIVGNELRFRSSTPLDFEIKTSYRVVIQVDDPAVGGFPDATASFTLSIGNVNEAPTDVRFSNSINQIAETNQASAGQVLSNINITDDGIGTNVITLLGNDANAFEVVDNQLRLKSGTILDFEAKPFFQTTVRVSDPTITGSPFVERPYRLNIANRPEVASLTDIQGQPLKSPIRSFRLTWDTELGDIARDAIRMVTKDGSTQPVDLTWQSSVINDKTVVDAQIVGQFLGPNGLLEGTYEISVDGLKTTTFSGASGLSYQSGNLDVLQPLLPGILNLTGPSLLRVGSPVSYQWSLTGLPDPQPTAVEYLIDFQGDGVVDRTLNGAPISSISQVVYGTASANTLIVTARVNGNVVATNSLVVNVSPEASADENWLVALDADRDSTVSPLDVLAVINRINSGSSGNTLYSFNLDTDRDGAISPLDVLAVINYINTPAPQRPKPFSDLSQASSGGLPGITKDLSISGKINDGSPELFATLDGGPKVDVTQFVDSSGRFLIQDAAIAQLFGSVNDGPHTLSLFARNLGTYSAAADKRFLSLKNHLKNFDRNMLLNDNGTLRLGWTPSASGASYNVWLSTNGNPTEKVRNGLATTQTLLPLAPGQYRVFIEATDGAGNSLNSPAYDFVIG